MNNTLPPAARTTPPAGRPPTRSRRAGTIGASTLITVASLAATAAGWAWIAQADEKSQTQQAPITDAIFTDAAEAPIAAASLPPLILAPIPTLAPNRPRAAQPVVVAEQAPAAAPPLRTVNEDSAALLVPQPQSQMQAAAPVVAPQAQPAPVTHTRTSRRRTR
jgi:hypothetical protein